MKRFVFVMFLIFSVRSSFAQDPSSAKVFFIRRTGMNGFAETYDVYIDKKQVCGLNNDRYSTHTLLPGIHVLAVQEKGAAAPGNSPPVSIEMTGGNVYYIDLNFGEAAVSSLQCQQISADNAKKLIRQCIKKPQCEN